MSEQTIPIPAGPEPIQAAAETPVAETPAAETPAVAVGVPDAPSAQPPRRRRRRLAFLAVLLVALAAFALFTGWYLVTRKPVSELPIVPPIAQATLPAYSFSMYGVTSGITAT